MKGQINIALGGIFLLGNDGKKISCRPIHLLMEMVCICERVYF